MRFGRRQPDEFSKIIGRSYGQKAAKQAAKISAEAKRAGVHKKVSPQNAGTSKAHSAFGSSARYSFGKNVFAPVVGGSVLGHASASAYDKKHPTNARGHERRAQKLSVGSIGAGVAVIGGGAAAMRHPNIAHSYIKIAPFALGTQFALTQAATFNAQKAAQKKHNKRRPVKK